MKNLFKTLITVLTVVCMLSSMTAFAASQTTVTTYNSDTSVNVATTVSGVAADVIVTYLVANDANENGVADADEIKYINQATSDGSNIPFNYAITGEGWTAGTTIAAVKFGSNNADTATDLNKDNSVVAYHNIPFSVVDANGDAVEEAAEISATKIGENYTGSYTISALPGYEITKVVIGEEEAVGTEGAYTISEGQSVVVTVAPINGLKVYLFKDATVTDDYKVYDAKTDAELTVVSGVGFYTGSAEKAQIKFAKADAAFDIDGEHAEGIYDAVVNGASSYFAVQLAADDATLDGVSAVQTIAVKGADTVTAE